MPTLLPNGKQQFLGGDGVPLAGGSVFFYIPSTVTPKTTWQDAGGVTPNTNPVVLDASGEAVIFGTGAYRQVVNDAAGNLIWDQFTQDLTSVLQGQTVLYGGLATGSANAIAIAPNPAVASLITGQGFSFIASANNTTTTTITVNSAFTATVKLNGNNLQASSIKSGNVIEVVYDGVNFQLLAPQPVQPTNTITAVPSVSVAPTGNPPTTLASFSVQTTTASETVREFMACLGFTVQNGQADSIASNLNGDKVALYVGADQVAGGGNTWAINTVTALEAGSGYAQAAAFGYELDFNNLSDNRGDSAGGAGLALPVAYGLGITGAGTFRSSAAMLIAGPGTPIWNRGLVNSNNAISQSFIQDLASNNCSFEIFGVHTFGIDMGVASFSNAAIRLANGSPIKGKNNSGSSEFTMMVSSGDDMIIGNVGWGIISSQNSIEPDTNGTLDLGAPGGQWNNIYCVALVQSSDEKHKEAIAPAAPMLDLVMALTPVEYKRKIGGHDRVLEKVTKQVHLSEIHEWNEVENVGGVKTPVIRRAQAHLFDEVQLREPNEDLAWIEVRGEEEVRDAMGSVVRAAKAAYSIPHTVRVPRMGPQEIEAARLVPREGKRTHLGFLAQDVEAAVKTTGRDYALFVRDEATGEMGIRPDELTAVLWRAVQELAQEIKTLKGAA